MCIGPRRTPNNEALGKANHCSPLFTSTTVCPSFTPNDKCPGVSLCPLPSPCFCGFCFLITPRLPHHDFSVPRLYCDLSAPTINAHFSLKFLIWIIEREYLTGFIYHWLPGHYPHYGLLTLMSGIHFWGNQLDCGWWEMGFPWPL